MQLYKRSSWLCRAVTGQAASERPLQRTKALELLKDKVQAGCQVHEAAAGDKIAEGFFYDDEDKEKARK